ncbi:class I SAM-dependent methyltransferase [Paracoccaceae bacterium]|jgi:hypothetical protein|nr:class I SAM-dependent methyltransferase [Paracoccaceae bacterium]
MKNLAILDVHEYTILWDLPQLPLTEKMGEFEGQHAHSYDQKLIISNKTGHVQLLHQLPPKELYTVDNYNFRTSETNSSMRHLDTFCSFVNSSVGTDKKFRSLVDIGGNDLTAIKRLRSMSESAAVVDPICSPDDNKTIDNVKIIGRFIEEVDLKSELGRPDLVFCRHTIEHISNPWTFIQQLFDECDESCVYLFEMPSFSSLIEAGRFDAIFHQHYHYFDLYSFKSLLADVGGEFLGHHFDHQGSCGGSLFVCFQKAKGSVKREIVNIEQRTNYIKSRITLYENYMNLQKEILENLEGKIFGYGGGLMLATLAYHLKFDLSRLECILDDEPSKDLQTYSNVPVTIRDFNKVQPNLDSNYLITSLENVRPIYRRITELQPRRVVIPCIL